MSACRKNIQYRILIRTITLAVIISFLCQNTILANVCISRSKLAPESPFAKWRPRKLADLEEIMEFGRETTLSTLCSEMCITGYGGIPDEKVDVFSFGTLLIEILTGIQVNSKADLQKGIKAIKNERLRRVVKKCVARRWITLRRRYKSFNEVIAALQSELNRALTGEESTVGLSEQGGESPNTRGHRFRKDIREALKQELLERKQMLKVTKKYIDRILNNGVARLEGRDIVFEDDSILRVVVDVLNEFLGGKERAIDINDLKEVLRYHEKLHLALTEDMVKEVRNELRSELDSEEYRQLLRYFENQYGQYIADGMEKEEGVLLLVEELIVNFYMEQYVGNLTERKNQLWLLDDDRNRVELANTVETVLRQEKVKEVAICPLYYTDWRPINEAIPDRKKKGRTTVKRRYDKDLLVNLYFSEMRLYKSYDKFTDEQQQLLWVELRKGNRAAFQALVEANTGLVIKIAVKYANWPGIDLRDLVQAGITGLMEAIRRFRPEMGNKLSAFTYWYIKKNIFQEIRDNRGGLMLPGHIYILIRDLKRVAARLEINQYKVSIEDKAVIDRLIRGVQRDRSSSGREISRADIEMALLCHQLLDRTLSLDAPPPGGDDAAKPVAGYVADEGADTNQIQSESRDIGYKLIRNLFLIFRYLVGKEKLFLRRLELYRNLNIYLLRKGIIARYLNEGLITVAQIRELEIETGFIFQRKALGLILDVEKGKISLQRIGDLYGISRERVNQIVTAAGSRKYKELKLQDIVTAIIRGEEVSVEMPQSQGKMEPLIELCPQLALEYVQLCLFVLDIVPEEWMQYFEEEEAAAIKQRQMQIKQVIVMVLGELFIKFNKNINRMQPIQREEWKRVYNLYLLTSVLLPFAVQKVILTMPELEKMAIQTGFQISADVKNALPKIILSISTSRRKKLAALSRVIKISPLELIRVEEVSKWDSSWISGKGISAAIIEEAAEVIFSQAGITAQSEEGQICRWVDDSGQILEGGGLEEKIRGIRETILEDRGEKETILTSV